MEEHGHSGMGKQLKLSFTSLSISHRIHQLKALLLSFKFLFFTGRKTGNQLTKTRSREDHQELSKIQLLSLSPFPTPTSPVCAI